MIFASNNPAVKPVIPMASPKKDTADVAAIQPSVPVNLGKKPKQGTGIKQQSWNISSRLQLVLMTGIE